MSLKLKREELYKAQTDLKKVFDEAGKDMDMSLVKSLSGTSMEKVVAIRKMNEDLAVKGKEVLELEACEKAAKELGEPKQPMVHADAGAQRTEQKARKSFGQMVVESKAYKSRGQNIEGEELDIEMKTLFETGVDGGAGWAPQAIRTGLVVPSAQRPIQVIDLFPAGQTAMNAVVYMSETTFTNNAAETNEGAAFGEAALALTQESSPVQKIAVFLPVSDEQLEDVMQASAYINNRLPFMLRQRLDSQLINGNGDSPNLTGILNVSGIQTQACGSDALPDAIYKAMVKVRIVGRALPSAHIINPYDWQTIRLMKTADGLYIWGHPSIPGPETLWGLPIAQADSLAQGTAITGDFPNFSELTEKRGIVVKVGYQNTDFVSGKQAVRADVRVAMQLYRPAAFCTVTGL